MMRFTLLRITGLTRRPALVLLGTAVLCIYSGCVTHTFYGNLVRKDVSTAGAPDAGYSVLAVEFIDQGAYFRTSQRDDSVMELRKRLTCGTLVIAFAHGWHHNAEEHDSYLDAFESKLLRPLSTTRRVVGIYIGWRGETSWVPGLNSLTFFGTKDAAETVGSGGVTELLLRTDAEVRRAATTCLSKHQSRPQFLVVGHSLGGLVVYSALSQLLVERFLEEAQPKTFGDLVVLVNPAFEAARFRTLHELSTLPSRTYSEQQRPLLLVAQSENDFATTAAFQTSRFFAKMFEDVPNDPDHIDPVGLSRTAIGHYAPYRTHCIGPVASPESGGTDTRSCTTACRRQLIFGETRLCEFSTTPPHNPVQVAQVSAAVMNGHDDIWNERFVSFLVAYVTRSLQLSATSSPDMPSAP